MLLDKVHMALARDLCAWNKRLQMIEYMIFMLQAR